MLGDVRVFPVPELLPGRSWGGDKGQGCSHLLLRCGRFCPLDIRTEGGRTRPCFVSVFPGVLLLSPHSSPCTLGSGACMCVCVCRGGGRLLCGSAAGTQNRMACWCQPTELRTPWHGSVIGPVVPRGGQSCLEHVGGLPWPPIGIATALLSALGPLTQVYPEPHPFSSGHSQARGCGWVSAVDPEVGFRAQHLGSG